MKRDPLVYLIGSLRNPEISALGNALRDNHIEVFDSWFAASPTADDAWKEYEEAKGATYEEALNGYAAQHVYQFDLNHLNRCDAAVLALPAGRSAHLELGYIIGCGKPGWVLLDRHDRWDVMYNFTGVSPLHAHGVRMDIEHIAEDITNWWRDKP